MTQSPPDHAAVDAGLVRRLVDEQHPPLAGLPVVYAAVGSDNHVFRLGDRHAVRLPRHARSAERMRHEQRWLAALAPDLPVAVPAPVHSGVPTRDFPWPWCITAWFAGTQAAGRARGHNAVVAAPLAGFLNALHRSAPAGHPPNEVRGRALVEGNAAVRARLRSGMVPHAVRVEELWAAALDAAAWPGPALWLHGDLHPGNLLVRGAALEAVVDFGELTAGDPATDLAAAWLVFDAAGRRAFQAGLGGQYDADPDVWLRARGWALLLATDLLAGGADLPGLHLIGSEALMELLTEDAWAG